MNPENIQSTITDMVANFDTWGFLKITLLLSAGCFFLGILLRIFCGKGTSLNKSVGAAMGILMIYVVSIALQVQNHYEAFLAPLPFISLVGDYIQIFSLQGAGVSAVCTELVNTMILAFLIGLIDDVVPKGSNFLTWYFFRCVAVVLGMAAHWASNWLFTTYIPGFIVTYAPVILIILVIVLLAVTLFKLIIGGILGMTVGPVVGAIYTFFVSHIVGKQITRAALTTLILTLIVYALNHFGITTIYLASAFISGFIPALIMIIIVWYLVFKFL